MSGCSRRVAMLVLALGGVCATAASAASSSTRIILAGRDPSVPWDVIHGNNGYFASVRAHYAKYGYHLASGLGVPQFAQLARLLPPPAPPGGAPSGLG